MSPANNRTTLLASALRLFSELGYDGVGVQEIVAAAGVTKPTLYHFFGSKRGLLEALVAEHFEPFEERLRKVADYRGDLTLTLTGIVRAYFAFAREDSAFYRIQLSMVFGPKRSDGFEVIAPHHDKQVQSLLEVFRKAGKDHGNMRGRQQAHAVSFLGMINSYAALYMNGVATLDEQQADQATHHFMHGIFS